MRKVWFWPIILFQICGGFRCPTLFKRAMHGGGRLAMKKNETVASQRSFYSSNFKGGSTAEPLASGSWARSISDEIIPTGPESLARIERTTNQDAEAEVLEASEGPTASKYFKMVESLAPNDMLLKFTRTAPKHVQEAAKSTILNILGSLPNYALDAALITTNTKLANLLYQMQMTGYMFKNAEYRMSLTRGLKGSVAHTLRLLCMRAPRVKVKLVLNTGLYFS
jgi:hypothetical protein